MGRGEGGLESKERTKFLSCGCDAARVAGDMPARDERTRLWLKGRQGPGEEPDGETDMEHEPISDIAFITVSLN